MWQSTITFDEAEFDRFWQTYLTSNDLTFVDSKVDHMTDSDTLHTYNACGNFATSDSSNIYQNETPMVCLHELNSIKVTIKKY